MSNYNPVWGRDSWTSLATFSADSAAANYPASNLGGTDLNMCWRSNNQKTAVLQFTLSKGCPVGMIVLLRHNMSQNATFRLQLYTDAAWTTLHYDSATDAGLVGGQDVWPTVYSFSQLDFEDDNCWTWKYRTDELSGQPWDRPIWLNDVRYFCQSGTITLTDTYNPAAYLQLGHLEICRGYQMPRGIPVGGQSGYAPNSIVTKADGGKEYGQRKIKPRTFKGTFPSLPFADSELIKEFKRKADIVPENAMYWHPYPTDPTKWARQSFWARFEQLDLHQVANSVRDAAPVSLREVL